MADNAFPTAASSLDPTAPSFTMLTQDSSTNGSANPTSNSSPTTLSAAKSQDKSTKIRNQPKESQKAAKDSKPSSSRDVAKECRCSAGAGAGAKMTAALLKKQKAAEKAARRAEKVAEKGAAAQVQNERQSNAQSSSSRPDPTTNTKTSLAQRRQSMSVPATLNLTPEKPIETKKVQFFSHLYPKEARATLSGAGREIHPSVLALALQLRDYVICGANARCAAMLLVFKKVIQAYITPAGTALSRNLTIHLSHQISFLSHARPLSISQGNSIRWLKKLISALDPDIAESDAKSFLCDSIDQFIREKITLADVEISEKASERIEDGDVILTYAKSSIVQKTLLTAHEQGKQFRVIVVDSRPLFEGKNLTRNLLRAGIHVSYALLSGLDVVLPSVTKLMLGASAMLGNGALYSRAGTAIVACMARENGAQIPQVIVLCESIKFTGKVALDSVVMNEIADPDSLVDPPTHDVFTNALTLGPMKDTPKGGGGKKKGGGGDGGSGPSKDEKEPDGPKNGLDGWKDQPNLYLLNLMYDVTPPEYMDVIVTELGSLPPRAAPVVVAVHGSED